MAASQIVNTLKTKIKENDEELQKYEALAQENREKYQNEKKLAEDVEVELLSLQRKIRLLEDKKDSEDERLRMTSNQLEAANITLENADGGREAMESKYGSTSDKIEELEKLLSEAKNNAQEADRRCEDIVRKLTITEHARDRAEEKAGRAEDKIKGLNEELHLVNKTIKTLSVNGDAAAEKEDNIQDQIREMKKRTSEAEIQAETSERAAQRLQAQLDRLQSDFLQENQKKLRMEEDMQGLMSSIQDI